MKLRATNTGTVYLPSLVLDDGSPAPIKIRRVAVDQLGVVEGLRLAQSRLIVQEGAAHSEMGAKASAASEQQDGRLPYSGTPNRHEINDLIHDPEFNAEMAIKTQLRLCELGCVEPSFAEICEAYGTTLEQPWVGMGHEYEMLSQMLSDFGGGVAVEDLPAAERFPKG